MNSASWRDRWTDLGPRGPIDRGARSAARGLVLGRSRIHAETHPDRPAHQLELGMNVCSNREFGPGPFGDDTAPLGRPSFRRTGCPPGWVTPDPSTAQDGGARRGV